MKDRKKDRKKERKRVMSYLWMRRVTHENEYLHLGTALEVSPGTHVTALCYTCGWFHYF